MLAHLFPLQVCRMEGFQRAQEVKKQVDAEITAENARNEVIVANKVNAIVRSIPERMINRRAYEVHVDYMEFQDIPSHLRNETRDRVSELLRKLGYTVTGTHSASCDVSCAHTE